MSRPGRPTKTTPEAWAQAALDEIEVAGVRALSVEAVARRLGVSKGGVYHHFADRRELLRAALGLWERRQVTELSARFDAIEDPRERLRGILRYAAIEMEPTIIVQLLAATDDPDVAAALARSTDARLAFLRRIFRDLGATPAVAEHRAIITYGHYLGLAEIRRHADVIRSPAHMRAHLEELERGLLAGLRVP